MELVLFCTKQSVMLILIPNPGIDINELVLCCRVQDVISKLPRTTTALTCTNSIVQKEKEAVPNTYSIEACTFVPMKSIFIPWTEEWIVQLSNRTVVSLVTKSEALTLRMFPEHRNPKVT